MAYAGLPYQSSNCWGKLIFSEKGNLPQELVEEGLPPEEPLPLTFDYELPEDGEVTIQLYDADGWVRRILVAQAKRRAGNNMERWSGLDDAGRPLPPGTYTWKGLYHQGITTKFLFSAHNSGQPPHKTDDGDESDVFTLDPAGKRQFARWTRDGRLVWGFSGRFWDSR